MRCVSGKRDLTFDPEPALRKPAVFLKIQVRTSGIKKRDTQVVSNLNRRTTGISPDTNNNSAPKLTNKCVLLSSHGYHRHSPRSVNRRQSKNIFLSCDEIQLKLQEQTWARSTETFG